MIFAIGDRVQRRQDVYDQTSRMMFGRIVAVKRNVRTPFGFYKILYNVRWDGHDVETVGYLPHGLEAAPEVIT